LHLTSVWIVVTVKKPDQTRGIYNRRRDGKVTKTAAVKAAANLADGAAVTGLMML
jgi:hypothetical protein